eukprot:g990.t1
MNMLKCVLILAISSAPFGLYMWQFSGRKSFKAIYSLLLACPPLIVHARQYRKWTQAEAEAEAEAGADHTGSWFACCGKAPDQFLKDFDGFVIKELNDISAYFVWAYYFIAPVAALLAAVLAAFMVRSDQDDAARAVDAQAVRHVLGSGMVTWGISAVMCSLGGTHSKSEYAEEDWRKAKAEFGRAHDDDENLADELEKYAKGSAKLKTRTVLIKGIAMLLSLPIPASGVYRFNHALNGAWPAGAVYTIAAINSVCSFLCNLGFFLWILVAMMHQYLTCNIIMRSLDECTKKWKAEFLGLPHIPLTTPKNIRKWYKLRQLFVTKRFNIYYALCGPSVSVMALGALCYVLHTIMQEYIKAEKECPHVFGIPVKPTFFNFIVVGCWGATGMVTGTGMGMDMGVGMDTSMGIGMGMVMGASMGMGMGVNTSTDIDFFVLSSVISVHAVQHFFPA